MKRPQRSSRTKIGRCAVSAVSARYEDEDRTIFFVKDKRRMTATRQSPNQMLIIVRQFNLYQTLIFDFSLSSVHQNKNLGQLVKLS